VVEASLLTGPAGSALVLANFTYKQIGHLTVDVKLPAGADHAVSAEGRPVHLRKKAKGVRLDLPLDVMDIILLTPHR